MKRIQLFIIASIFIASTASAQISKGSVLLGGGVSASKGKSESNGISGKSNGFNLRPSFGFAHKDNQVIGFTVGYGRGKTKYENSPAASESNTYSAGVFYRRYHPLSKSFYLFGEAGAGYNHYKSEEKSGTAGYKNAQEQMNIGLSLFPGITYAVSKRFHLEASLHNLFTLYYNKSKIDQTFPGTSNKQENSGVSLDANVSTAAPLTLGFRFVLGK